VDVVTADQADIGFFAIDPLRGQGILFTSAYVLIEGSYLVHDTSLLQRNEQVDNAAHRVTVGKGSAYDLYLTRSLKDAQIVRALTSPAVVDTFLANGDDVAAGVKQQLESDAKRLPGLRLLPGRFMVIEQAMGVPKSRSETVQAEVAAYVEEMKASGFVAESLARHHIEGAVVAPAAH
jgi:polar amino acid transport system substrate-binding protein